MPAAKATMQGWVYSVWFSTPSGSVKETVFRSKSTSALSSTSLNTG